MKSLDYKKLQLLPASLEAYPLIQNMGRFYVYDISEYLGHDKDFNLPEAVIAVKVTDLAGIAVHCSKR